MRRIASSLFAVTMIAGSLGGCIASTGGENDGTSMEAVTPPPPPIITKGFKDIPMNGLPTVALTQNLLATNKTNSPLFVSHPLATATFASPPAAGSTPPVNVETSAHDRLADAAADAQTLDFLRYVVACALNPTDTVTVGGMNLKGQLGLCPAWATSSADLACQERVSACVVMFNNPLSVTVPLSVRGPQDSTGILLPYASEFRPAHVQYKETGIWSQPIASLQPCTDPTAYGVSTACGWNPRDTMTGAVGTCVPNTKLYIGTGGAAVAGGKPLGSATGSGDTVLRVCQGLRGCDPGSVDEIVSNDDSPGGVGSFASFVCPAYGAFSVEVAPYHRSETTMSATVVISTSPTSPLMLMPVPVTYPAAEPALFTVREGAFWGNIFDATKLTVSYTKLNGNAQYVPTPAIAPGTVVSPYAGMFSCADPSYRSAAAYSLSRVCSLATPTANAMCAATSMGVCSAQSCGMPTDATSAYGTCRGGAPSYTSFLHDKCDVTNGLNCR